MRFFFSVQFELTHSLPRLSSWRSSPRGSFVPYQQVAVEWQVNSWASTSTPYSH